MSPATATVATGATQQFTALGRLSDGATQAVTVTWSTTSGTVSSGGLFTAPGSAGSATVRATQQGGSLSGTATVTVTSTTPPPAGAVADPTLLPTVTGQLKDVTAYNGLNVRGMAAGASYADPVTGVRVWKVTTASTPQANPIAGHDYSEGPAQVSREWGTGTHTLLVRLENGPYYLVDLTRGSGLSNWRQLTSGASIYGSGALSGSFSRNPATPQILYVCTGSRIVRVNTATNQVENTGNFPASAPCVGWLSQDKNDVWFTGLSSAGNTVFAWNSQTGELRTRTVSGLDEPYFDKDGRYVFLNHGSTTSTIWDLQLNTTYTIRAPGQAWFGHQPGLRGFFMVADVNIGGGVMPVYRLDPTPTGAHAQISNFGGYAPDYHWSGQWIQENASLPGGDLTKQWVLVSTMNETYTANGNSIKEGIGYMRADGSDFRLLAHHYSTNFGGTVGYYSLPRASSSPDGKLVLFDSSMLGSGRADLFAIEVPSR